MVIYCELPKRGFNNIRWKLKDRAMQNCVPTHNNFYEGFLSDSTNTWMCVGRVMQEQLPRHIKNRIVGYVTVDATPNMKKASKMLNLLYVKIYD